MAKSKTSKSIKHAAPAKKKAKKARAQATGKQGTKAVVTAQIRHP